MLGFTLNQNSLPPLVSFRLDAALRPPPQTGRRADGQTDQSVAARCPCDWRSTGCFSVEAFGTVGVGSPCACATLAAAPRHALVAGYREMSFCVWHGPTVQLLAPEPIDDGALAGCVRGCLGYNGSVYEKGVHFNRALV